MLLLPEDQLPACSRAIRAEAVGTGLGSEIDDVIAFLATLEDGWGAR